MHEWVGWVATALFAASYFCRARVTLLAVQAVAAVVWIAYGLSLGAAPVIVANAVVAASALWSMRSVKRQELTERREEPQLQGAGAAADRSPGLQASDSTLST